MTEIIIKNDNSLISDIKKLITEAKGYITYTANSKMTVLYWQIGKRINQDILQSAKAQYGQEIVRKLAQALSVEYGKGFTYSSLTRMIKFYETFPEDGIVATVSQLLTWSHIIELLPIEDDNKRDFYAYTALNERWSVRRLRTNINKMYYERTSLAKYPAEVTKSLISTIKENQTVLPDVVLKDPYLLDFLGLPDQHYESELENAILQNIEQFILELGVGFSFISRQKRITIDNEHFYLDLLLYNRKLKRLVAIELKSGRFKAEYKGQMELYLNWLKKNECYEGENSPIGIILCAEKSHAQIELLDMSKSDIHVAEYWTQLPPLEIFEKKIQEIVLHTRQLYENQQLRISEE